MPNSKSPQQGALAQLDISALPGEVVASLFDRNPLPMWIYDLQSLAFLAVNDAAVERYGYSREDFLAMTIADIRPPDDIEALYRNRYAWQDKEFRPYSAMDYEMRLGAAGADNDPSGAVVSGGGDAYMEFSIGKLLPCVQFDQLLCLNNLERAAQDFSCLAGSNLYGK